MGTKISQLPAASVLTGTEEVPIVQSGATKRTTVDALALTPLAASSGSSLVGFIQAGTGAIARTVQAVLRESVSVFDFMTPNQIADIQARTALVDTVAAINAAITSLSVKGGMVYFPPGVYRTSAPVAMLPFVSIGGTQRISGPSAAFTGAVIYPVFAGNAIESNFVCVTANDETNNGIYDLMVNGDGGATRGIYYTTYRSLRLQRVTIVRPSAEGIYLDETGPDISFTCDMEDVYVNNPGTVCYHWKGPWTTMTRCVSDLGTVSVLTTDQGGKAMITNCHFEGASNTGIYLFDSVGGSMVTGNNIIGYSSGQARLDGIRIGNTAGCTKNVIVGNTIAANAGSAPIASYGIVMDGGYAANNMIDSNTLNGYINGIFLQSDNNVVNNCYIGDCTTGVFIAANTNFIANCQIDAGTNAINNSSGNGNSTVNIHNIAGALVNITANTLLGDASATGAFSAGGAVNSGAGVFSAGAVAVPHFDGVRSGGCVLTTNATPVTFFTCAANAFYLVFVYTNQTTGMALLLVNASNGNITSVSNTITNMTFAMSGLNLQATFSVVPVNPTYLISLVVRP